MSDATIRDTLAKFGEPMAGSTWRVQGTAVIYHKALERIAVKAKITFDPPQVIRAERDEAVVLVVGRMGERTEWSFGEALVGANYRVSGKQAAYVWAMAEKRAKDRVILKLIELSGLVYSEDEADEFKQARPQPQAEPAPDPSAAKRNSVEGQSVGDKILANAKRRTTWQDVIGYMKGQNVQDALARLDKDEASRVAQAVRARLIELGWSPQAKDPPAQEGPVDDPTSRNERTREFWDAELLKARLALAKSQTVEGVHDDVATILDGWNEVPGWVELALEDLKDERIKQIDG